MMSMNYNKKYLLLASLITSFIFVNQLNAQDLHFSQFYEAPLLRNPALAGLYEGDVRIQGIYKNQWNSISYPYQTGSINGEYKFGIGRGDDFLTVGGQVMYDKAGTVQLQTVHLLPMVNFHKSLSQEKSSYLSLGFMGGIVDRRLDRSKVTTNSQYDGFYFNGALPDGESFSNGYMYADMSVGMSLNSSLGQNDQHNFFVGAAYHHFNKPINSFYKNISHLPKFVFSAGLKLNVDEMTYVTFNGDFTFQEPFREAIAGAMFSKRLGESEGSNFTVHAGSYYRYNDAIIPVIKFDVNQLSLGLSYDVNVSTLSAASKNRGGFELSLTYIASRPHDNPIILCPKF